MKYSPDNHHRRSIRLPKYDYSQPGEYFITLCVKNRLCLFGEIVQNQMKLSPIGEIARASWQEIPKNFQNAELDEHVLMPNHIHGIIRIDSQVRAIHESPIRESDSPLHDTASPFRETGSPLPKTVAERRKMLLPKIIGWFKMNSAKLINEVREEFGIPFWQRGYYEHIIHDVKDLDRIRRYILENPMNWSNDDKFPGNIRMDHIHREDGWSSLD